MSAKVDIDCDALAKLLKVGGRACIKVYENAICIVVENSTSIMYGIYLFRHIPSAVEKGFQVPILVLKMKT